MGRDTRETKPKVEPGPVKLAEFPRVPDEAKEKVQRLNKALHVLMQDERLHFRNMRKIDVEFHENGDVTVQIHRTIDGSFVMTVPADKTTSSKEETNGQAK